MADEITNHGFKWGLVEVTRVAADVSRGGRWMCITTPRQTMDIYITKTGLIRVHDRYGKEWKPSP